MILSRKKGESFMVGEEIKITIIDVQRNQIKIGIDAPRGITVLREELVVEVQEENQRASVIDPQLLKQLPAMLKKNKKRDQEG